jgi:hypothetical protein
LVADAADSGGAGAAGIGGGAAAAGAELVVVGAVGAEAVVVGGEAVGWAAATGFRFLACFFDAGAGAAGVSSA